MKTAAAPYSVEADEEISTLIATLHRTERRLEELTGGEVDAVADPEGGTFLLRRAQERLRHRQAAKQAAILDALPAHIAMLDAQGVIRSVNETWRQFAGESVLQRPGYAVGLNYLEICADAAGLGAPEAHAVAEGIRAVLAGGHDFSFEYACHTPMERRWFLMRVAPLADAGPRGAVVMHVNITERKLTEQALRESEGRFRGTFEQAAVGIAHVSTEGRFLRLNDKLCAILGYERADLLGMTFMELTLPEDQADGQEARLAILAGTQSSFTSEKRYRQKSGEVVWVNLVTTLERTVAGDPKYFISIFEDITRRKQMEESLLRSQASMQKQQTELRVLFDLMPAMIWFKDTQNGILRVNQRVAEVAGKSVEDIEGKPSLEVYPEDAARFYADDLEVIRSGVPKMGYVERLRGLNEQDFWVQTDKVPYCDKDGKVIGIVVMAQDITERKQAEQQLAEQAALIDETRDAITVTDLDRRLTFWSKGAERLYGWAADEAKGCPMHKLLQVEADKYKAAIRTVRETGE